MCLILFAYRYHPQFDLVVAANRDEFYDRPTAPAHFWEDYPGIFAGRDLQAGGTWLAVTKTRQFAALTNYRDPHTEQAGERSRGELPLNVLQDNRPAREALQYVKSVASQYNGFNLIVFDGKEMGYFSNRENTIKRLEPGVYGLSNHLLDTPWPKVVRGKTRLVEILQEGVDREQIFELLTETACFPDDQLPHTGVGIDRERTLSPLFIQSESYGTRSSTVLTLDTHHRLTLIERTYQKNPQKWTEVRVKW